MFKPHPNNPKKMVPFDLDGEIHFSRCGRTKASYKSLGEICCAKCEAEPMAVYFKQTKGGERIAALCMNGHVQQIPYTEQNGRLVNATEEQVQLLIEFHALEESHGFSWAHDCKRELRRKARLLMRTYRDKFGVSQDLRAFTKALPGQTPWWYAQ